MDVKIPIELSYEIRDFIDNLEDYTNFNLAFDFKFNVSQLEKILKCELNVPDVKSMHLEELIKYLPSCQVTNAVTNKILYYYRSIIDWKILSQSKHDVLNYFLRNLEQFKDCEKNFIKTADWKCISQISNLPEFIIVKYSKYIHWFYLDYTNRSIGFFEEFKQFVNWDAISLLNQNDIFLEKFKHELNWKYCTLWIKNENTLIKFYDYVDWNIVSHKPYLSYNFVNMFKYRLNWKVQSSCRKFSENFARKFSEYFYWDMFHSKFSIKRRLFCQSKIPQFSEKFLREFKDNLDWKIICKNQKLSEPLMIEMQDVLDWELVSIYQEFSESFLNLFRDKLNKSILDGRSKIAKAYWEAIIGL